MCGMPAPSKPSKSEMDYRAEEDFRMMERAEEVRGDKARHERAMAHGRKKVRSMARVMGKGRSAKRSSARA